MPWICLIIFLNGPTFVISTYVLRFHVINAHYLKFLVCLVNVWPQSELLRSIPLNQTSDVYTSRIYFEKVTLTLHNLTLMSQKPYHYNNKFDCSETNGFNIPQDALNEVNLFSIKYRYSYIELQKKKHFTYIMLTE